MKLMLCVVLLVTAHTITMVMGLESPTVTLFLNTKLLEDTITQVEATDGSRYLAVYQPSTGVINCFTDYHSRNSTALVQSVMDNVRSSTVNLDKETVDELFQYCGSASSQLEAIKILASLTNTTAPVADRSRRLSVLPRAGGNITSWAIFPHTKWCGPGNNATNYNDLGVFAETDKCCRTHDHCPYNIAGWTRKYDYLNMFPWTISHCDCDHAFKSCLGDVTASNELETAALVKKIYFEALSMPCFELGLKQPRLCSLNLDHANMKVKRH